jgi:hypothetical protein
MNKGLYYAWDDVIIYSREQVETHGLGIFRILHIEPHWTQKEKTSYIVSPEISIWISLWIPPNRCNNSFLSALLRCPFLFLFVHLLCWLQHTMGRKFEKNLTAAAAQSKRREVYDLSVCPRLIDERCIALRVLPWCWWASIIDAYGPFFSWISKQQEKVYISTYITGHSRVIHAHQLLLAAWKIDSPISKFFFSHFFDFVLWTGTRLLARWLYTYIYVSSWCHIIISREELNITAG